MLKHINRFLGNIKLTTMIASLVISAVIVSVSVVTLAIYLNLSASVRQTGMSQQVTNLKTAATIVEANLPGATTGWAEDGSIETIQTWAMPRQFLNHEIVDSIGRITGQEATIFGWDAESHDFVSMTTTLAGADDARLAGMVLGADRAAHAAMMAGDTFYAPALRPRS